MIFISDSWRAAIVSSSSSSSITSPCNLHYSSEVTESVSTSTPCHPSTFLWPAVSTSHLHPSVCITLSNPSTSSSLGADSPRANVIWTSPLVFLHHYLIWPCRLFLLPSHCGKVSPVNSIFVHTDLNYINPFIAYLPTDNINAREKRQHPKSSVSAARNE